MQGTVGYNPDSRRMGMQLRAAWLEQTEQTSSLARLKSEDVRPDLRGSALVLALVLRFHHTSLFSGIPPSPPTRP